MTDVDELRLLLRSLVAGVDPSQDLAPRIQQLARAQTVRRRAGIGVGAVAAVLTVVLGVTGAVDGSDGRSRREVTSGRPVDTTTGATAAGPCRTPIEWDPPRTDGWGFRFHEVVATAPVAAGTTVLVGSNAAVKGPGCTVAFDADTARPRWTADGAIAAGALPVVVGDVVVVPTDDAVVGRDLATGRRSWQLDGVSAQAPLVRVGDALAVPGWDAVLVVDPGDGRVVARWPASPVRRVVVGGDLLVWADAGSTTTVVAVDAGTLRERWRASTHGGDVVTVTSELVVVEFAPNTLIALDRDDGSERWRRNVPGGRSARPVEVAGRLVVATDDRYVVAYDQASGREAWRVDAGTDGLLAPVLIARGDGAPLVVAGGSEGVVAVDAERGSVRWRSSPVDVTSELLVAGDRVFAGTATGTVVSVELASGATSEVRIPGGGRVQRELVRVGDRLVARVGSNRIVAVTVRLPSPSDPPT